MTDNLAEVYEFFRKAEVRLDEKDVWEVKGTPVVKHKALERLQRALKIKFRDPVMLRHERDEAVLIVTGVLGDETEWSIGEACVNVNYQVSPRMAAYVYAMAEKRAKDRVILKLANLAGVYSEDEADEFKQQTNTDPPAPAARGSTTVTSGPRATEEQIAALVKGITRTNRSMAKLLRYYCVEKPQDLSAEQAAIALKIMEADQPKAAAAE